MKKSVKERNFKPISATTQKHPWGLITFYLKLFSMAALFFVSGCPSPVTPPSKDSIHDRNFFADGVQDSTMNAPVVVTSQSDTDIYIGGRFTSVGQTSSNNIAMYSTYLKKWLPVNGMGLMNDVSDKGESIVNSIIEHNGKLYVGGNFNRTADNSVTDLNGVAILENGVWKAFPNMGLGPFPNVRALKIVGDKLYIGGKFSQTFDGTVTNLNRIAVFDLTTETWSSTDGIGLDNEVYAFENDGVDLYVGGSFSNTFDSSVSGLNRIAKLDTSNGTWSALTGNGLSDSGGSSIVKALEVWSSGLFVGGDFSQTFDGSVTGIDNIAEFKLASQTWNALGDNSDLGLNSTVETLTSKDGKLFVGGRFTNTMPSSNASLNNIAIYIRNVGFVGLTSDTKTSSSNKFEKVKKTAEPVGTVTPTPQPSPGWTGLDNQGLNNAVFSVEAFENTLIVGGRFTSTNDESVKGISGIVSYDFSMSEGTLTELGSTNSNWQQLGESNGLALNDNVHALVADASGNIYVGGEFTETADGRTTNLNGIAIFNSNTKTWSALANNGLNGDVLSLAISGNNLYVGGGFTETNDGAVTNLNRIAHYNLTTGTWSTLTGNGLKAEFGGRVSAIEIIGDEMYVGGYIAETFDDTVTNLNNIARYNLTNNTWSALSENGVNQLVFALASSGDDLYVGGAFTRTFDSPTPVLNNIARYATSTNTWSAFSNSGLDGLVTGLEIVTFPVIGDVLYANGVFFNTADATIGLNRIASYRFSDSTWLPISADTDVYQAAIDVNDSVIVGNEIYVGGSFTGTNDGVSQYIAHYYLQQWQVPSTNMDWFDSANWTIGTPAANTSAFIPTGTGNINITSADVALEDLMLNDGTINVGVGRTLTINGNLSLNGGVINGDGTVVIADCNRNGIYGGSPTSYIQAALVRCVDASGFFNFPIGSINGFSPVQISNVTGTGNFTAKANSGEYAGTANDLPNDQLQSYWDLTNGGITSADVRFNYQQSDVIGNENNYRAYRINGGNAEFVGGTVDASANSLFVPNVSSFSPWAIAAITPTAANVSVGGRILTINGRAIKNAFVFIQSQNGEIKTVRTNQFGYYRISDIMAGETYIFSVRHRHYQFVDNPRVVSVSDSINGLNFIAESKNNLRKR